MQSVPTPPLFARQSVFDADLHVWGHELLYRQDLAATQAEIANLDAATLTVVVGVSLWHPRDMAASQKILVNFSPGTILGDVPYALSPQRTVIQMDEAATFDPRVQAALAACKADGYLLALDGYQARPQAASALAMADLAIIDVLNQDRATLADLVNGLGEVIPVAKRVEDQAAFAMARELGFQLFLGNFFHQPQAVAGKRLASNEQTRLKLLRLTQSDTPDVQALDEAIRSDVTLSYRLLAYLSSPLHIHNAASLSMEQAILALGWKQLRTWLRVIALTDSSPTGRAEEIAFLSLVRAKFFEFAALSLGESAQVREELFTLGLFSLLDELVNIPMQELLAEFPLEDSVRRSLLGPDGPLSQWTAMARCFEQGDWDGLGHSLDSLGISPKLAAASQGKATLFARLLMNSDG